MVAPVGTLEEHKTAKLVSMALLGLLPEVKVGKSIGYDFKTKKVEEYDG